MDETMVSKYVPAAMEEIFPSYNPDISEDLD
jgi:hypothetical protein